MSQGSGQVDETPPILTATGGKKRTDWWAEAKGLLWVVIPLILLHSLIAKPFYIPSESMMPALLKGDRLVVSKYPYGWSWVSPTFNILPRSEGRLLGEMPTPGDIVILRPEGHSVDWIKRVIALPGDTVEMVDGRLHLNGKAVKRERISPVRVPIDANAPCDGPLAPFRAAGAEGADYCELPRYLETLPNGRAYATLDLGPTSADNIPKAVVPEGHVWLMGDNRDMSADSRVAAANGGLGGPVPWDEIGGRAEFITFSMDGSAEYLNPVSWFAAMRGGRAGTSLHPLRAAGR